MKKLIFSLLATIILGSTSFAQGVDWDRIGRYLAIGSADFIGAGAGVLAVKEIGLAAGTFTGGTGTAVVYIGAGVICGAGASYQSYQSFKSTNSNKSSSGIQLTVPPQFSQYNIGARHNEVLDECYLVSVNPQPYLYTYYNRAALDYLYNHKDWNTIKNNITASTNKYNASQDIRVMISDLKSLNYLTNNMSTFYNNFITEVYATTSLDGALNVVNSYVAKIVSSNYSEHEKIALFASMSVASESFKYWAR